MCLCRICSLQVLEFIEGAMKEIMKNPRVVKKAQAGIREALLAFSRRKGKKIFQPRVFLFFLSSVHQDKSLNPSYMHAVCSKPRSLAFFNLLSWHMAIISYFLQHGLEDSNMRIKTIKRVKYVYFF